MRKNQLVKPKLKTQTFKVSNFIPYSALSSQCLIDEKVQAAPNKIERIASTPSNTQSAYFLGNRLFVYTSDKYIYEYINYSFKRVIDCPKKPILMTAMIGGVEEVLVICGEDSFMLGQSQTKVTVPEGDYWANYNNRLFIAKSKNLYFSGDFDYDNLTMDISNFGLINVTYQDGNIIGLVPFENKLVVFCNYAIYTLNISADNEFTFTKCNTCAVDIIAKSVAKVGDEIIFVSNRKICSYKNGKVEIIDTIFEKYLPNITSRATGYNGHYAINFNENSVNYVYMFNCNNRKANILNVSKGEFIGGKYYFASSEKEIYQINELGRAVGAWASLPMDFGTHRKKILTEVGIYSNKNDAFYIFSDSVGYRFMPLKSGNNYKKMNLLGKDFRFEFFSNSIDMEIKDLQIKYIIVGD